MLARNKHSSLSRKFINYGRKDFYMIGFVYTVDFTVRRDKMSHSVETQCDFNAPDFKIGLSYCTYKQSLTKTAPSLEDFYRRKRGKNADVNAALRFIHTPDFADECVL
jgi:hypothetical protein